MASELTRIRPVVVIDAYASSPTYMRALAEAGVKTRVACPSEGRSGVGGRGLRRLIGLLREVPSLHRVVRSLRQMLPELSPAAIVVIADSALVAVHKAVGTSFPIVYYMMGEAGPRPWYSARLWSDVDLCVGLSPECLAWLAKSRHEPRRTAVVPNGLDLAALDRTAHRRMQTLPRMDCALKLLYPATLIPLKAQDVAIRAVARLRDRGVDVHLWLSGSRIENEASGYASQLAELVKDLGLKEHVSFLGWLDDIVPAIASSDAVILTSRTEGIPCSLMQAMALRKPVIATRVGGVPGLVRDGVDGLLVEVGDVDAVCNAILRLNDASQRIEMGRRGRERIEQSYTVQQQAATFARLVDSLPRKGSPSTGTVPPILSQAVGVPGVSKGDDSI